MASLKLDWTCENCGEEDISRHSHTCPNCGWDRDYGFEEEDYEEWG
jgi:ribosomal protein L37E